MFRDLRCCAFVVFSFAYFLFIGWGVGYLASGFSDGCDEDSKYTHIRAISSSIW